MGILAGAMSGFGAGLADIGDTNIKADIATKAREQESNLATQRAQTMEVFRNNLATKTADDQRTAQAGRIDAAAGKIAEPAIAAKRGIIGSNIASPNDWTDEQQAAVDQSLAIDKAGMVQDPAVRERAAISTGDISPDKASVIMREDRRATQADDRAVAAEVSSTRKDATARYIAEMKDATAQARLEALVKNMGGGKSGTREALAFIDGARKDVASEAADARDKQQSELKAAMFPEDKKAVVEKYAPKFDAIEKKRRQLDMDFDALREGVGLPPAGGKKAEPSTAKSKGISKSEFDSLPSGSQFTAPDGSRRVKP